MRQKILSPVNLVAGIFVCNGVVSCISQKTLHARPVIQLDPQFSGSGFELFQSLPRPFRWTRVTEALGTILKLSVNTDLKKRVKSQPRCFRAPFKFLVNAGT